MRRTRWLISILVAIAVLLSWSVVTSLAQDKEAPKEGEMAKKTEAPAYTYVGVKTCGMCHKKDESGNQLAVWEKQAHAKAYETLATEAAMTQAKAHNIENPQKAPECLKCHITAFPVMGDLENQKITLEEGVSCESCHGPGSEYKSMKNMKGIFTGEIKGESVGLLPVTKETCMTCHDPESPFTADTFDYDKALAQIAHPYPEGFKAAEK